MGTWPWQCQRHEQIEGGTSPRRQLERESAMPALAHVLLALALLSEAACSASSSSAPGPAGSRLVSVQSSSTKRFHFDLIDLDPLTGVVDVNPLNGSVSCTAPDPHIGKECLRAGATTNGAGADIVPPIDSPTGSALVVFTVHCMCPVMIGPHDELIAYGPPIILALDVRVVAVCLSSPRSLVLTRSVVPLIDSTLADDIRSESDQFSSRLCFHAHR